jgi:hypothetical protein
MHDHEPSVSNPELGTNRDTNQDTICDEDVHDGIVMDPEILAEVKLAATIRMFTFAFFFIPHLTLKTFRVPMDSSDCC